MARMLVVPGVSVETRFDVPPPLPARSGILGAVGVVDRAPAGELSGVTSAPELLERFGAATRYAFPEVMDALANGISELFVSPVDPRSGRAAELTIMDDEGQPVALLRARAVGPWGNALGARVVRVMAEDGRTVRRLSLEISLNGVAAERFDGLVFDSTRDNDFFSTINRDSGLVVAIDPDLMTDLPAFDAGLVALADAGAQPARGRLRAGNDTLVEVTAADAGGRGNRLSLSVGQGRASRAFAGAAAAPSIRISARTPGLAGTGNRIGITGDAAAVTIEVQDPQGNIRSYGGAAQPIDSVAALLDALSADPTVAVTRLGDVLPAATAGRQPLLRTVTVTLAEEGVSTTELADLDSAAAIAAALDALPQVTAALAAGADGTRLPDVGAANANFLSGGHDAGPARAYAGQDNPDATVLELVPAPGADAAALRVRMQAGTLAGTARITAGLQQGGEFAEQESFDNLSMDPDDPRYLPAVLAAESNLLRALDRFVRRGASHLPAGSLAPQRFTQGAMPGLAAWQAAVDALAQVGDVDLVLAGLQGWKDTALAHLDVQRALAAHATAQADLAKPRIALAGVNPATQNDPAAILSQAAAVAGRRLILVAPGGAEGAVAGLLGHLDVFQSPTFKTVASLSAPLVPYTESDLNKLVGPEGNVCVVLSKRGRGTIVVKGITSDGFQINVLRTADRCVREVSKIADRFIGQLNNSEQRGALRQMIVDTFTQMERDGALVPSMDGKDPAFTVQVYGSQTDFAAGILRVDIAVRPVRAIDYVYATIRVRN
ncbi:hypothetical protein LPC08_12745 [Roseomonas sp. OT10]|uniref:hypothetical protein n=1 Tax=Roseomonas cutis TaxID=2897332 RepID=UPI001E28D0EE|nr:hypothetical protein [Roseomonas sp. OT10]UFN46898.1 hypothetical protein LPC08_12745 [Roseomonas sp. OT10]